MHDAPQFYIEGNCLNTVAYILHCLQSKWLCIATRVYIANLHARRQLVVMYNDNCIIVYFTTNWLQHPPTLY